VEREADRLPRLEFGHEEVAVITGGEPLLSPHLGAAVAAASRAAAGFRIATGGHIAVRALRDRLAKNPAFLGFNMGTDVLFRQDDEWFKRVWHENWELLSDAPSTWLTITLGDSIGLAESRDLIADLRPKSVMLNEMDTGYPDFEKVAALLSSRFSDTRLVEGYRA
jgi:hypothetical protein